MSIRWASGPASDPPSAAPPAHPPRASPLPAPCPRLCCSDSIRAPLCWTLSCPLSQTACSPSFLSGPAAPRPIGRLRTGGLRTCFRACRRRALSRTSCPSCPLPSLSGARLSPALPALCWSVRTICCPPPPPRPGATVSCPIPDTPCAPPRFPRRGRASFSCPPPDSRIRVPTWPDCQSRRWPCLASCGSSASRSARPRVSRVPVASAALYRRSGAPPWLRILYSPRIPLSRQTPYRCPAGAPRACCNCAPARSSRSVRLCWWAARTCPRQTPACVRSSQTGWSHPPESAGSSFCACPSSRIRFGHTRRSPCCTALRISH